MTDYSIIHNNKDWLEEVLPGKDKNSVILKVRTTDGGLATFRVATRSLLERMKETDQKHKSRKT